jgi:hypothetical protein
MQQALLDGSFFGTGHNHSKAPPFSLQISHKNAQRA